MRAPWHWHEPWFTVSGLTTGLLMAAVVMAFTLWLKRSCTNENERTLMDATLDRLREMFGIEATDVDGVFDALERYDRHMHQAVERETRRASEVEAEAGWLRRIVQDRDEWIEHLASGAPTLTVECDHDVGEMAESPALAALRDIAHIAEQNPRAYGMASIAALCERAIDG